MAQMRTAKSDRLVFKKKEREAIKKNSIKYNYRRARCKLSSMWKEPQGLHEVDVKRWFALAVLFSCLKEAIFTDSWTWSFLFLILRNWTNNFVSMYFIGFVWRKGVKWTQLTNKLTAHGLFKTCRWGGWDKLNPTAATCMGLTDR